MKFMCGRCGETAKVERFGKWYCERCAKIGDDRIKRDIEPKKKGK